VEGIMFYFGGTWQFCGRLELRAAFKWQHGLKQAPERRQFASLNICPAGVDDHAERGVFRRAAGDRIRAAVCVFSPTANADESDAFESAADPDYPRPLRGTALDLPFSVRARDNVGVLSSCRTHERRSGPG
jgi:hypothetical protein